jgi:hypothetical protein
LTPGITEPLVSRTVPEIEPVSTWANIFSGKSRRRRKSVKTQGSLRKESGAHIALSPVLS